MSGKLTVGTMPIGNYMDCTLNLIESFKTNDIIVVESAWWIEHIFEKLNLDLMHKVVEIERLDKYKNDFLIDELKNGKNILLVSDDGSTSICDPGMIILKNKYFSQNDYSVLPGPSAITSSFDYAINNGIYTDNEFHFYGFITDESILKIKDRPYEIAIFFLRSFENFDYLSIFNKLSDNLGNRNVTMCIDLTTKYEKIFKGKLFDAYDELSKHFLYAKENYEKEKVNFYITLVLS
jgi:16S rRNA (cytidine1402-2'-O)-methyltransferase